FEEASHDVINEVRALMSNTIANLEDDIISDVSMVQARLRSVLKKYLRNKMDRKPMILPIIMEM
ncbi:MAG: hypothetical protein L0Y62_02820, partial [Nitrospirae bacterium]|nr:hypothetical protein [Nitrospirota bacterium]